MIVTCVARVFAVRVRKTPWLGLATGAHSPESTRFRACRQSRRPHVRRLPSATTLCGTTPTSSGRLPSRPPHAVGLDRVFVRLDVSMSPRAADLAGAASVEHIALRMERLTEDTWRVGRRGRQTAHFVSSFLCQSSLASLSRISRQGVA